MEHISRLLRAGFKIIVFFIAISLLYMMSDQYDELVKTSLENASTSTILYKSEPPDAKNYVSKAELTSLLMGSLEYDIEINDGAGRFIISAEIYSPADIEDYPLTGNNYIKSYLYHMDGTISRIVFNFVS